MVVPSKELLDYKRWFDIFDYDGPACGEPFFGQVSGGPREELWTFNSLWQQEAWEADKLTMYLILVHGNRDRTGCAGPYPLAPEEPWDPFIVSFPLVTDERRRAIEDIERASSDLRQYKRDRRERG